MLTVKVVSVKGTTFFRIGTHFRVVEVNKFKKITGTITSHTKKE